MIRQETPKDYDAVYALVKEAFEKAPHRDGNEQDLVAALRRSDAFVPALSLVAEREGRIVGYILFTELRVAGRAALALAPLAVLPAYQGQGVGSALVREGHRIAREMGYPYAVVLGSTDYYPRFGYRPAAEYGIRAPFDLAGDHFMAVRLLPQAPPLEGVAQYAREFGLG